MRRHNQNHNFNHERRNFSNRRNNNRNFSNHDNNNHSRQSSGQTESNWYQESQYSLNNFHQNSKSSSYPNLSRNHYNHQQNDFNTTSHYQNYTSSSSSDQLNQGYEIYNSFPTPPPIRTNSSSRTNNYVPKDRQRYHHHHNSSSGHHTSSKNLQYLTPHRSLKRPYEPEMSPRQPKASKPQTESCGNLNVVCAASTSSSQQLTQHPNNNKRKKPNIKENPKFARGWVDAFSYVMNKLKILSTKSCEIEFENEVEMLTKYLQISDEYSERQKSEIENDLMNLVKPLGVKNIFAFGSKLTGLAFLHSDIDYYVELLNPPQSNPEVKTIIDMVGKLTRTGGSKGSKRPPFFVKCTIIGARIPLIRLVHRKYFVTCDVNFTTKNGSYNSNYIKSVLSFDKRIKDVALILKLWSKANHLNERMVVSNYCLVNMLFFYLQNITSPLLDSLKNVRKNKEYVETDPNSKWSFYFDNSMNKCHQNSQSTRELVEGFFEFYNKINFVNYVICLYSGNLVKRDEFENHEDLENYRKIIEEHQLLPFKLDNEESVMIQDAFEQNINIGIKNKKIFDTFTECTKNAYKKCTDFKQDNFSKLLFELFTAEIEKESTTSKTATKAEKKDKKLFQLSVHSTLGDLKVFIMLSIY